MDTANVVIRTVERQDMRSVMQLIKELADYERMPDQVKINRADLERDCFDHDPPLFKCFVAHHPETDVVVGYALYYFTYSTWLGKSLYLEDLCVRIDLRKKGIGKKLFLAVAREAYENNSRLDFSVLSWNPAVEFYKKFGAQDLTVTEKWHRFRLGTDAQKNLFSSRSDVA